MKRHEIALCSSAVNKEVVRCKQDLGKKWKRRLK